VLINIFNTITTNSPNAEGMTAVAAWDKFYKAFFAIIDALAE
jgi:hypothetical protein